MVEEIKLETENFKKIRTQEEKDLIMITITAIIFFIFGYCMAYFEIPLIY